MTFFTFVSITFIQLIDLFSPQISEENRLFLIDFLVFLTDLQMDREKSKLVKENLMFDKR